MIPLNSAARRAVADWSDRFPAHTQDDQIFPLGWRKVWRNALKRAGFKVRFHDLRHTAITKLAESQASEQTIMSIAGHVSRAMLEHYSHIRLTAKRNALDSISTSLPGQEPKVVGADVHQNVHHIAKTENGGTGKLLN